VQIREATGADWAGVWAFLRGILAAGETYTVDRDLPEEQARGWWLRRLPGRTFVAVDGDRVLGSAKLVPNLDGGGAHVANASFIVDPAAAGRGVGRALGEFVLAAAVEDGYRAMQFNAVVESNTAAVGLWRSLGFSVLTTVPEAFDHPRDGLVGLHIMHRRLGG
jgi:ribosomal protein S18 acetylase RimI-like enzyme